MSAPPVDDADVVAWTTALGLDGLIDLRVHFLPEQVMAKVWAFFDQAAEYYGTPWAVRYRQMGWFGVAEIAVFLAILIVGYVWAWKKGALEWV